jgi:hypothetical protein
MVNANAARMVKTAPLGNQVGASAVSTTMSRMTALCIVACFLASLLMKSVDCQALRRPKIKPSPRSSKDMMRALTINYPLHFFDAANADVDWRKVAKYSSSLVAESESSRTWSEHSFAQDQEDVWLYENWFYGMTEGVIMESGALNGILFSNSRLFETFANWTAIHVGRFNGFPFGWIPAVIPCFVNDRGGS